MVLAWGFAVRQVLLYERNYTKDRKMENESLTINS